MAITAYSLGAAQEVTGSKHFLEINGRTFEIDCGAFQGRRKQSDEKNRNFNFPPEKLASVILTHAHYDHCGLLPILTKNGYDGNIYATPATRDLANLVMMDSARIQARDAEFLRKKAAKKGEKFDWQPLFTEADCTKTANQIITVSYNRKMFIAEDVELEFFDAGHILGSSMAELTILGQQAKTNVAKSLWHKIFSNKTKDKQDKCVRILFTGDLGRPQKPIIRPPATNILPPDYIFIESTYGDRRHEGQDVAMQELAQVVKRAIEKKGKIIIPSFAIERAQELVYFLHLLTDQKKIPPIPIYVDSPMAVNATGIFQVHPECYDEDTHEAFLKHHKNPFGFGALRFTTSVEESKSLNQIKGPMIIISADGMCEAGRILHHLANNISNPDNTILIVGFMAQNTLGRKIKDGAKEVRIMGDIYKVNATIEQINSFSAHADYTEILSWLKQIDTSRLKRIFMVHGEKEGQKHLEAYLKENGFKDITIVKYGENYEL